MPSFAVTSFERGGSRSYDPRTMRNVTVHSGWPSASRRSGRGWGRWPTAIPNGSRGSTCAYLEAQSDQL
jgi:hypothetical protein